MGLHKAPFCHFVTQHDHQVAYMHRCCCHCFAGVKVDVQNQLELVGTAAGQQGGQSVAEAWHAALEDSIAAHVPGNALINCMCHNTSVSVRPQGSHWLPM